MKVKNINLEITAISIVIIFAIAISLIIAPEQSLNAIDGLFNFVSTVFVHHCFGSLGCNNHLLILPCQDMENNIRDGEPAIPI